ncbi:DUF723 domain-containing protein [Escherichia coli]|nr:DUF723 domain-containing protein [Escherichia coli]
MRRLTTEEFIEKAQTIHGDKYDYFKVEYKNNKTPVCIICPEHGEFWQTPVAHAFKKHGCPRCGGSAKKNTEEFIKEAMAAHGDKYDYSLVKYANMRTPVKIVCPEHGVFEQYPENHLYQRNGCPECYDLRRGQSQALTHKEHAAIIHKANPDIEILEKITNDNTKVQCRCKICGYKWSAKPNNLKSGRGCCKCAQNGFLSHEYGKLYIMVDDLEVPTLMKIGVCVKMHRRKNEVLNSARKSGAGVHTLHVVKTWSGSTQNMVDLEKSVHKAFSKYKINFPVKFDGSTEFFYYRPEVFDTVEEVYKKICGK